MNQTLQWLPNIGPEFAVKINLYYKHIVNFLKKSDPNKMIKGEYLECGTSRTALQH